MMNKGKAELLAVTPINKPNREDALSVPVYVSGIALKAAALPPPPHGSAIHYPYGCETTLSLLSHKLAPSISKAMAPSAA